MQSPDRELAARSKKDRSMPEVATETVDILALNERAGARERHERIGSVAAGVILSVAAATRGRAVTRALLGAAGALLLAKGASGLSVRQMMAFVANSFKRRKDLERRFNDGHYDIVDAASFDSFPASDPPSYSPGVG